MSNREASIKIKLDSQEFIVKVKGLGEEAEKAGTKIGSVLHKGFEKGKEATKELFSSIKGLIGLGATLGGAFSFEEGIRHAMKMEGNWKAISRAIKQTSGEIVTMREAQESVEAAAHNTTVSTEELAASYLDLINTTGKADFAKAAMQAASQEATRTGKSFQSLSSLAGDISKKFDILPNKVAETLRMITANTDIGGPKLDELANGFDLAGAVAESGGLRGEHGLALMLGMMNKTAPVLGRFAESGRAMQGVFSALQAPAVFNKIREMTANTADSGFVKRLINAPDALSRMDMILQKGGAVRKEFEKGITDRKELALYKILVEPFDKSVEQAMQSGLKGKGAMEAGAAAFKASLEGLTKAGDSKEEADKELAARMQTSKAKLDQAMKQIEEAFAQPEVIKAIKDLMGLMPQLVKVLAPVIEFLAKHPLVGAAGIVAAPMVKSVATTAIAAAAPSLGKAAWAFLKGAPGALAGGAATGMPSILGASGAAGAGIGAPTSVGGVVVAGGAAAIAVTAAAAAAAAAGVGAAGYAGRSLYKQNENNGGTFHNLFEAISRGGNLGAPVGTPEQMRAKAAEFEARHARAVEKSSDVHETLARNVLKASNALERFANGVGGTSSGNTGSAPTKGPSGMTPAGPGWADKWGG